MATGNSRYPSIGDYAAIGDTRTVALVSRSGSLDWLCLPRFDSPALFAALLDAERGGTFAIRPKEPFTSERRYLPGTNVLETTFTTAGGQVQVTDFMPVTSEARKARELWPDHQVLRGVEALAGRVEMEVVCAPRPVYGRAKTLMEGRGPLGVHYASGSEALTIRSEIPLELDDRQVEAWGREVMEAGDRRWLSLVYAHGEPLVIPPFGDSAERKLQETLRWWREWSDGCRYEGPHREAVVRSALALKLLTYAPSGAVVAAPTTSLPEWVGGVRNWDYRYCWLRDASLTLQSLMDLGYQEEASAFVGWLLHSTRITWPQLSVMYDVHGGPVPKERELSHLEGFKGSRPVRVGNGAAGQLQLDIYGNVADAAYQYARRGGRLDRTTRRMLKAIGRTVERRWRDPDEGIWEIRSEPRHHTYSKAMCWVAMDRLLRLHRAGLLRCPASRFRETRRRIREAVEAEGFNEEIGSYVTAFGTKEVDASLLMLPRFGYVDAREPRMRGTCDAVHRELGVNGMLYRYRLDRQDDGLPGEEGAFGICSFWSVDCLALQGSTATARERFQRLLELTNDVGLYAEEFHPESGAPLGNFPQAFTHVGLIDAAITLQEAEHHPPARFLAPAWDEGDTEEEIR